MKIRVADYIIQFLESKGIKQAFTVTGGGAMYLNDALAQSKQIKTIFNHHEQACAMAAVGYSKVNNQPALVMTTTGCGGTNSITGLLDAWQDSNKVFFISGNVNSWETTNPGDGLRKKGVQEADIISIVKSITKYSVKIDEPLSIVYQLEKAWEIMEDKRPGPVWLDIPMDIQGAIIETDQLVHREIKKTKPISNQHLRQFEFYLKESKRPIVIAGNGIKLSGSEESFKQFIEKYNLPVVFTYLTIDLLPSNHPNYVGRLGTKGDRAGNFALQNSDLVISLGSSLSIPVIGFKYDTWAREAKKFVVDIDSVEHNKGTVKIDYLANCDLKQFLEEANKLEIKFNDFGWGQINRTDWKAKCLEWRNKWNIENEPHKQSQDSINIYTFLQKLSKHNKPDAITITDAGSAYYVVSQALKIKDQQRFICSGAQAEMGFALPAAIGVAKASDSKNITVVTGDGSFQMNIQELQTIKHYNLPIKIFVLNNGGYLSIKNTQNKFFQGRHFGVDEKSGISFPPLHRIANAYDFHYFPIKRKDQLEDILPELLNNEFQWIVEIFCNQDQEIIPSLSAKDDGNGKFISQPLENMYPFLLEEEFKKEMIIKSI